MLLCSRACSSRCQYKSIICLSSKRTHSFEKLFIYIDTVIFFFVRGKFNLPLKFVYNNKIYLQWVYAVNITCLSTCFHELPKFQISQIFLLICFLSLPNPKISLFSTSGCVPVNAKKRQDQFLYQPCRFAIFVEPPVNQAFQPSFLDINTTVSTWVSLSKLNFISPSMIGSLNIIDFNH